MKQFNLEEYLKNPDRHIVTRKGIDAKIICTDGSNKTYPIFALIQNGEGKDVLSFTNEGMNTEGYESSFDLLNENFEWHIAIYFLSTINHLNNFISNSFNNLLENCRGF